ncbi:methylmalonyl-CoA mutase [candidate division TA06 bacterium]|uniref:Methylmalonyl-CoA mutase n=1 Tax=candidate division TA06 bacterium TaxID=2250710 RepID=A0A523UZ55_UNCT6|nr:MAG: methylmalonyl-CoA mutase [candidate division TA06 bacterium]
MKDKFGEWKEKADKKSTRDEDFTTVSGQPVDILYLPFSQDAYAQKLGFPGEYPYTRGIHPSMYRGRLWTMRLFSGFGSAEDTNQRYHFLLERGQTGLSVAFDFPTLYGRDSDDPLSEGEVGVCGVTIDTLRDMETLFDGIPLDKISTSMTINGPAAILLALYVAVGEKQGVPSHKLTGTIQNDILKEYIAQKSWIFPPEPSMRIITDTLAFCKDHVPKWNTISISGYHIREAGSTAAQELAFTLADGFAYVEAGIEAGLDVDDFAPRLSFFFNAHIDLFEEAAKYRAARRIWAGRMKEKYKAKKRESRLLRFHTQTAGCSLTAQQPENNIIRTTIEALAGVLGGTQSLHTNSMDEALALPTARAAKIALRTQQIIAHESGVTNSIDPLGGSYYVEALTDELERQAEEYFKRIDDLGGMIKAIEEGFPQKEIADAAYRYQKRLEGKRKIVVGVNQFTDPDERVEIPVLKIDPEIEKKQKKKLQKNRKTRDNGKAAACLEAVRKAAQGKDNLLPKILDAVRAYCTEGEIVNAMKEVFGEYREKPVI